MSALMLYLFSKELEGIVGMENLHWRLLEEDNFPLTDQGPEHQRMHNFACNSNFVIVGLEIVGKRQLAVDRSGLSRDPGRTSQNIFGDFRNSF